MGGSGRYPGTSIESSMWSGRYQVLQKYPEPDPEPVYLGSGRHRVAKPGLDAVSMQVRALNSTRMQIPVLFRSIKGPKFRVWFRSGRNSGEFRNIPVFFS